MSDACIYLSPYEEKFLEKNSLFQGIPSDWTLSIHTCPILPYLEGSRGHLDALYKVWKYNNHEYVGFSHDYYLLSLSKNNYNRNLTLTHISKYDLSYYGWNPKNISKITKNNSVFIPRITSIEKVSHLDFNTEKNLIEIYEESVGNKKHLEGALSYIKDTYPDKYNTALNIAYNHQIIPWNTLFAPKNIFDTYCEFLFDVIEHIMGQFTEEENKQADIYLLSLILTTIFHKSSTKEDEHYKSIQSSIVFIKTFFPSPDYKKIISTIIQKEKKTSSRSPKNISYRERVNLLLSFDDNYAGHAHAVINSILAHTENQSDIDIYILYGDTLSENIRNKLLDTYKDIVKLIFIKVSDEYIKDFPETAGHLSQTAYYRLFAQDILPETVKRLIYLDTDIIVCDNIIDLWNTDLKGHIIAGAGDCYGVKCKNHLLGRASKHTYINSGVLLYDIEKAKETYAPLSRYFMKIYLENYDKIELHDQDILNIAFKDNMTLLPLRWNLMSSFYYFSPVLYEDNLENATSCYSISEIKEAVDNPAILHFVGRRKPWGHKYLDRFKKLYWHYRMQDKSFKPSFIQFLSSRNYYIVIRNGFLCFFFRKKINVYQLRGILLSLKAKLFSKKKT